MHETFTGLDTGDVDLTAPIPTRRRSASGGSSRAANYVLMGLMDDALVTAAAEQAKRNQPGMGV